MFHSWHNNKENKMLLLCFSLSHFPIIFCILTSSHFTHFFFFASFFSTSTFAVTTISNRISQVHTLSQTLAIFFYFIIVGRRYDVDAFSRASDWVRGDFLSVAFPLIFFYSLFSSWLPLNSNKYFFFFFPSFFFSIFVNFNFDF